MVVLIVDDQTIVVSGIFSGVNWKRIGIEEVYKAYNAFEAREILRQHRVDILVCDIEMPAESGLSLVHWIREQNYSMECIFLTAHADFEYAKKAIELDGFDYILQPARYEDIEIAVSKAVMKIRSKEEVMEFYSYGKMLYNKKEVLLDTLLKDWFKGEVIDLKKLLEDLKKLNITISEDSKIYYILFHIVRKDTEEELEESLLKYSFNNIISELFAHYGQKILLTQIDMNSYSFIIYSDQNLIIDKAGVIRQLEKLIDVLRNTFLYFIACYIDDVMYPVDLRDTLKNLGKMKEDNVMSESGVFLLKEHREIKKTDYELPDTKLWENLLVTGCAMSVKEEALNYLERQSSVKGLDGQMLRRFYQDFMKILFLVAERINLSLYEILDEQDYMENMTNYYLSLEDVKKFVEYSMNCFGASPLIEHVSMNQIQKIIQYIRMNIESDIRRNDIAEAVYLNPNYISRLFKNKMNISLKTFITEEKMKVAQALLKETNLPVSMIAEKVGYCNFSHFSQVYKKSRGVTPVEERKCDRK